MYNIIIFNKCYIKDMLVLKLSMRMVSYQKIAWRSDEKNGFSAMPIWLQKRALSTHFLRFSCEMLRCFI